MYRYCFLLLFLCNSVKCDDCVTVDFENGFEDGFTNEYGMCIGFSAWSVEQYSAVDVESPHPQSANFITPQPGISCIASFKFTMTEGGALEVNVHTMPVTIFDQLTVRVFQSTEGGDDVLIGTAVHIANTVPDWETIRMTINGHRSFEGYVTFQALTLSANPIIWIDSFRYIGPTINENLCVIYEDNQLNSEDCVIEDFENDFEDKFTNNDRVCVGLSGWDLKHYSFGNIESPHPRSTSFIAPHSSLSCVSSFEFAITAGGVLQINVYMMPLSQVDQLTVTVFQSVIGGNDITIGRVFHNEMSPDFKPGWQTVNMTVVGPSSFEGYITFHALSMSPEPIIWIDSFRYIGPTVDEDSCLIYNDKQNVTIEPTSTTSITPITTTTEVPNTTTTESPDEDCVIEDFENSFEDNFTNNHAVCVGLSGWELKHYSFGNIESPHPRSTSFIAPQSSLSCVSSFKFAITAGGVLQINVYMMPLSLVDQLTVTVFQSIVGGNDINIGRVFHNEMNPGFKRGWQTVNMTVVGPSRFEGYITFHALSMSPEPIIWIDSFRYFGPFDEDSCIIYNVQPTPNTTPSTTTVLPNDDCVTVDFEKNFDKDFNTCGVCAGFLTWIPKQYSSENIPRPHPRSTIFIAPESGLSCVSSFTFPITEGGIIQVNAYIIAVSPIDQLTVTVFQSVAGGNDVAISRIFRNGMSPDFVPGWQTLSITVNVPGRFEGYVTFQALTTSTNPIIWIDSFRYIGPLLDEESCMIYEEYNTTTTSTTTDDTTTTTTDELSTTTTNTTTDKPTTTTTDELSTTTTEETSSTTTDMPTTTTTTDNPSITTTDESSTTATDEPFTTTTETLTTSTTENPSTTTIDEPSITTTYEPATITTDEPSTSTTDKLSTTTTEELSTNTTEETSTTTTDRPTTTTTTTDNSSITTTENPPTTTTDEPFTTTTNEPYTTTTDVPSTSTTDELSTTTTDKSSTTTTDEPPTTNTETPITSTTEEPSSTTTESSNNEN